MKNNTAKIAKTRKDAKKIILRFCAFAEPLRFSGVNRFFFTIILSAACLCLSGCVSRKITIDSEPQGAKVFFDYKQVGETPCSFDFIHYGGHHLELVKDGYENLNATVKLKAPIYEYIPLDFFAENILPFRFKDEHAYAFSLTPGVSRAGYIIPERKKIEEEEREEE